MDFSAEAIGDFRSFGNRNQGMRREQPLQNRRFLPSAILMHLEGCKQTMPGSRGNSHADTINICKNDKNL